MQLAYTKSMILGIDEVGRGPWAGPLVMGAVVLSGVQIEGLTDSKKLTKKRREELAAEIHNEAAAVGLGWVSAQEIDTIGLGPSLALACRRAVEQITVPYHEIVIDGTVNFLMDTSKGKFATTMKKADLLVPSVSAASIVAKVARDAYMAEQDAVYPGYKFGAHVGYGTAAHRAAIAKLGVTPLHRLSFAPLRKYSSGYVEDAPEAEKRADVTKTIGDKAEDIVTMELVRRGHVITERNWKTKYCEIDIVSVKGETVYFTEVKYRKNAEQGGGLAAITTKKHNQMTFAAKLYTSMNKLKNVNLRLAAASVTGKDYVLEEWFVID